MMSAFAELEANLLSERTKKVLHLQEGDASVDVHQCLIIKREIKFLYDEQK